MLSLLQSFSGTMQINTSIAVLLLLLRLLLLSRRCLLLRDLELRSIKTHKLRPDVFFGRLNLRLRRRFLLLLELLRSRCKLSRLLLNLADVKSGRFGTGIVGERRESRMAR